MNARALLMPLLVNPMLSRRLPFLGDTASDTNGDPTAPPTTAPPSGTTPPATTPPSGTAPPPGATTPPATTAPPTGDTTAPADTKAMPWGWIAAGAAGLAVVVAGAVAVARRGSDEPSPRASNPKASSVRWYIVVSTGIIQGVYGSALYGDACALANKIEAETGVSTKVKPFFGKKRPRVGQAA